MDRWTGGGQKQKSTKPVSETTTPQQTVARRLSAPASICSSRCVFRVDSQDFLVLPLLPSVSPDSSAPSLRVGVGVGRGWGGCGRSVLIIEVGSADVPSSLSARILPLALFSVSFFNLTCSAPSLVDLLFSFSVCAKLRRLFHLPLFSSLLQRWKYLHYNDNKGLVLFVRSQSFHLCRWSL